MTGKNVKDRMGPAGWTRTIREIMGKHLPVPEGTWNVR